MTTSYQPIAPDQLLNDHGPDSAAFTAWDQLDSTQRGRTEDGRRVVPVTTTTGDQISVPWYGPHYLTFLQHTPTEEPS